MFSIDLPDAMILQTTPVDVTNEDNLIIIGIIIELTL